MKKERIESMKRKFALILMLVACICVISACGEKKDLNGADKTEVAEGSKMESSEDSEAETGDMDEADGKIFTWGDVSFKLTDLTYDLGDWESDMDEVEGQWAMAVFTITDGKIDFNKMSELIVNQGGIKLGEYLSKNIAAKGVEIDIETKKSTVVGTIHVFFDVAKDYKLDRANIYVDESLTVSAEEAPDEGGVEITPEEIQTIDGISVESAVIARPVEGKMIYSPSGTSAYFAVDGMLKARTAIHLGYDATGVLNYDLSLSLDSAQDIKAEVRVFKDGKELASYSEEGLALPAGDTVINTCIQTNEGVICSGEYTVRFYINDSLVSEDVGTI